MVMLYAVMFWLCYGYVMAVAMAAASAGREAMLQLPRQPGEDNVSVVPMAPRVFFQPLSLCLAYPGFSKQCGQREQPDRWCCEQDQ